MKKLIYRKKQSPKKRIKTFSICQKTEDKECITDIKKSFVYKIYQVDHMDDNPSQPQIFIKKSFDSKKRVEKFSFKVRGYFYMTHNRFLLKVRFRHSLNIHIQWKSKVFSPKKSAVLT